MTAIWVPASPNRPTLQYHKGIVIDSAAHEYFTTTEVWDILMLVKLINFTGKPNFLSISPRVKNDGAKKRTRFSG
jgi:hypothetical protein